jgi:hypothetical protein
MYLTMLAITNVTIFFNRYELFLLVDLEDMFKILEAPTL